jgi:hypothetical protein
VIALVAVMPHQRCSIGSGGGEVQLRWRDRGTERWREGEIEGR